MLLGDVPTFTMDPELTITTFYTSSFLGYRFLAFQTRKDDLRRHLEAAVISWTKINSRRQDFIEFQLLYDFTEKRPDYNMITKILNKTSCGTFCTYYFYFLFFSIFFVLIFCALFFLFSFFSDFFDFFFLLIFSLFFQETLFLIFFIFFFSIFFFGLYDQSFLFF